MENQLTVTHPGPSRVWLKDYLPWGSLQKGSRGAMEELEHHTLFFLEGFESSWPRHLGTHRHRETERHPLHSRTDNHSQLPPPVVNSLCSQGCGKRLHDFCLSLILCLGMGDKFRPIKKHTNRHRFSSWNRQPSVLTLSPLDSLQEKHCGLRQRRGNPKIILLNSNHFMMVETHPLRHKYFLTVLSAQNPFENNLGAPPRSSCLTTISESLCNEPHYALTFSPSHIQAWQQHQRPQMDEESYLCGWGWHHMLRISNRPVSQLGTPLLIASVKGWQFFWKINT